MYSTGGLTTDLLTIATSFGSVFVLSSIYAARVTWREPVSVKQRGGIRFYRIGRHGLNTTAGTTPPKENEGRGP